MEITQECRSCGADVTFNIPDDHDGTRVYFECPDCQTRNEVPGEDPAVIAVAAAAVNEPDVLNVTDGEVATAGDKQS